MKWVAVAILLLIVPYTIVTLRYRKEGPAFQPYDDMKSRANVARLLAAGYQRLPLVAQRPADGTRAATGATIAAAPGGLPADLKSTLVEPPLLPVEIGNLAAAAVANTIQSYAIQFTATLPDDKQQLGGAELFVRENALVIVPTFERVAPELLTRARHNHVLLTVPAGALKPGRYTVTLVAERASHAWTLDMR